MYFVLGLTFIAALDSALFRSKQKIFVKAGKLELNI